MVFHRHFVDSLGLLDLRHGHVDHAALVDVSMGPGRDRVVGQEAWPMGHAAWLRAAKPPVTRQTPKYQANPQVPCKP